MLSLRSIETRERAPAPCASRARGSPPSLSPSRPARRQWVLSLALGSAASLTLPTTHSSFQRRRSVARYEGRGDLALSRSETLARSPARTRRKGCTARTEKLGALESVPTGREGGCRGKRPRKEKGEGGERGEEDEGEERVRVGRPADGESACSRFKRRAREGKDAHLNAG